MGRRWVCAFCFINIWMRKPLLLLWGQAAALCAAAWICYLSEQSACWLESQWPGNWSYANVPSLLQKVKRVCAYSLPWLLHSPEKGQCSRFMTFLLRTPVQNMFGRVLLCPVCSCCTIGWPLGAANGLLCNYMMGLTHLCENCYASNIMCRPQAQSSVRACLKSIGFDWIFIRHPSILQMSVLGSPSVSCHPSFCRSALPLRHGHAAEDQLQWPRGAATSPSRGGHLHRDGNWWVTGTLEYFSIHSEFTFLFLLFIFWTTWAPLPPLNLTFTFRDTSLFILFS